jgi:2-methylisocitrate lyase-like PEP mutase family enzyme
MNEASLKRKRFRELLAGSSTVMMPGGFSPMYARMAESIGFQTFFVAGSQMASFLLGVPDNGVIGLRDVVDHGRHVASSVGIPVLLDADTGFGNAVNVAYSTKEIVRSGVAGLQLEDMETPRRLGAKGLSVISLPEATAKVLSAVRARDEIDPEFVVVARCDALSDANSSLDDVVARCVAYAEHGRADMIWLNAVQTRAQLQAVCKASPVPVLCNWMSMSEPPPSLQEYEDLGCRIALFPVVASLAGLQGAWEVLNDLQARGSVALTDWAAASKAHAHGAIDFRRLNGMHEAAALGDELAAFEHAVGMPRG